MRRKPAPRSRRQALSPAARPRPLVVGLGASAGGLEVLRAFFGAMPPHTGLAFVVVVHLDPTHESLLPELLARSTALIVGAAEDCQPLEADHVYIIPPNRTLTLDQGLIRLHELADRRGVRGTIDRFFRSLAADQRPRAVAIVFSRIPVEVDGHVPESLRDGNVATPLYRIAQAAVTNAVKHAEATTITIRIVGAPDVTTLQVLDNGSGLSAHRPASADGVGLRIMRYRASSIGGSLSVEPGTGGGTVVTCTVRGLPRGAAPAAR